MLSKEFLQERSKGYRQKIWAGNWTDKGNIQFIIWNNRDNFFDGHFDVVVNPETFEYRVQKHSDYGGLANYIKANDAPVHTAENLTQEQREYIEPCIAKTLLDLLYPSITSQLDNRPYSQWLSSLIVTDDAPHDYTWKWKEFTKC